MQPSPSRSGMGRFNVAILVLGILSLFLENIFHASRFYLVISNILDFLIYFLFVAELAHGLAQAADRRLFLRTRWLSLTFLAVFSILFFYAKYRVLFVGRERMQTGAADLIVLYNIFIVIRVLSRINKLNYLFRRLSQQPAQTIAFSFLVVILAGTVFLMMPFAAADGVRLGFLEALFTATSAVCVTGLIVVDTATRFSPAGQAVIMVLIQIGGLGIMVLSSFAGFLFGKRLSLEEKMTISYMLNESDMTRLSRALAGIVSLTFLIEGAGALLLYPVFAGGMPAGKALFFSGFHAVSAFCNAGFALLSDSLEGFKTSVPLNAVICGLIILGGLSFGVMMNLWGIARTWFLQRILKREIIVRKLSLDARVVASVSALLLAGGTLLFYALEHGNTLKDLSLGRQYLAAFFQSVTLRTAGFNTVSFAALAPATCFMMLFFMFIGGAAGSTAGGIKVNSVGAVFAYIRSIIAGRQDAVLSRHVIGRGLINQAFLVIIMGLAAVFGATLILLVTESHKPLALLFEATSAFATVGLSTGITADLSAPGRLVIIGLMFLGRLGPLTILTAFAQKSAAFQARYPDGHLNIG